MFGHFLSSKKFEHYHTNGTRVLQNEKSFIKILFPRFLCSKSLEIFFKKGFFFNNMFYSLVACVACFKCVSVDGDNPSCEDKFHNNATEDMVELVSPCMGGRKGRDGLFPASDCIKVTGSYGESFLRQF